MLMKRFFTLTMLAALMAFFAPKQASAQYYDGVGMKGKVIVGANLGFGYGRTYDYNHLNFELCPQVGYRIIDQLEIGARLVYHLEYSKARPWDPGSLHPMPATDRQSCNYFGVAPYINFEFWRGFYVQAEYEGVYGITKHTSAGQQIKDGQWYNSLPLGIGYRLYLGASGFAYVAGFYNVFDLVNETDHPWALSPYNSPWVARVGFCWGF